MGAGKAQPKGVTCARHCRPPAWAPAHAAPHPLTVPGKDLPSQHRGPHAEASLLPLSLLCVVGGSPRIKQAGHRVGQEGFVFHANQKVSEESGNVLRKLWSTPARASGALTGLLQSSLELGPLLSSAAALQRRPGGQARTSAHMGASSALAQCVVS